MRRRGPGIYALVDGIAHRCIGRTRALGSHVAFCGEACHQVIPRGEHRDDGALRHGLFDRLQVFRARMQKQMDVRVDEPRQQRAVTKVDDFRSGRMRHGRANVDYPLPLDEHLAGTNDPSGLDIEQTSGMQNNGARSSLLRRDKRDQGQQYE